MEAEPKPIAACCVCGKPIYKKDNPVIGTPGCVIRHRECVPKKAR